MQRAVASKRNEGFAQWDLMIIIAVLALLAVLLLPTLVRAQAKSTRISCVYNLKQIGLAFRMWSNENLEQFPWVVSVANAKAGTLEFAESAQTWCHFQTISNQLPSPKVLVCPTDTRRAAMTWKDFTNNGHLSYFIGLDADETLPQMILTGDRNLASTVRTTNGILRLSAATPIDWTKGPHNQKGNVCLADGSVE